jgi:Uma2 family endonuclease
VVQVQAGSSLRTPMSREDFITMAAALGETKFHEYYDGCLVVNPPTTPHGIVVSRLIGALFPLVPSHDVTTETGWQIGQELFIPDVMVVDRTAGHDSIQVRPPWLVIEVLSPSTRDTDQGQKFRSYAAGGADWYWTVDLERAEVSVFQNQNGAFHDLVRAATAAVLPPVGLRMDPRALTEL